MKTITNILFSDITLIVVLMWSGAYSAQNGKYSIAFMELVLIIALLINKSKTTK